MVELERHGRLGLALLLTQIFRLERIVTGYGLFSAKRKGVIKVAIKP